MYIQCVLNIICFLTSSNNCRGAMGFNSLKSTKACATLLKNCNLVVSEIKKIIKNKNIKKKEKQNKRKYYSKQRKETVVAIIIQNLSDIDVEIDTL